MPSRAPRSSPLPLPPEYGAATTRMAWSEVDALLTEASVYWIATVRPDGRPHVIPSYGIWLEDALYVGGSGTAVHIRNARSNPQAIAHVGDGLSAAIMIEGTIAEELPTRETAERLVNANNAKYDDFGFAMDADAYLQAGVTALHARRVLVWTRFPENATRFVFE